MRDPLKEFAKDVLKHAFQALKDLFRKFLAPVLVLMLVLGGVRSVIEGQGNSGATFLVMCAGLVTSYAVFKIMKRNLLG